MFELDPQRSRLRALRLAAGLSKAELARRARVSPKTVQRAEAAEQPPASRTRIRLAEALGTFERELWPDLGEDPRADDPGRRLRAIREQRRLTPEAVAKKGAVSAEHLRRIERGEVPRPSDRTLARLGEILDTAEIWELWDSDGPGAVEDLAPLVGEAGQVSFRLGTARRPSRAPLVTGAQPGWGPLDLELRSAGWSKAHDRTIRDIVEALEASREGALIAFVDLPDAPRPLALCQTNHSLFYERRQPPRTIEREYFRQVAYALLEGADERFRPRDVELGHLTVNDWPPALTESVLEGIGQLVDQRRAPLALHTVHLNPCCLTDRGPIDRAMQALNVSQAAPRPPDLDPAPRKPYPLEALGLAQVEGLDVVRLDLPPSNEREPATHVAGAQDDA